VLFHFLSNQFNRDTKLSFFPDFFGLGLFCKGSNGMLQIILKRPKIKLQPQSSPDKDLGLEWSWQGIVESFTSLRCIGFFSVVSFVGLFSTETKQVKKISIRLIFYSAHQGFRKSWLWRYVIGSISFRFQKCKNDWRLGCIFCAFGICVGKSCS